MAWSSKVFILLLVIVSLITTPGRCQQSQTNSSSGTSSSPTVITLSIIGGIVGFVAIIVPVFVYMCYRVSKAKQQRRDFYIAAPSSQTQAVYLSYSSQTTTTAPAQQQAPPTVVYNASYSHYHDSAGNYSGGRPYQSRVLYSIDDQPNDSRASAPQNTRYVTVTLLFILLDIFRQRVFSILLDSVRQRIFLFC